MIQQETVSIGKVRRRGLTLACFVLAITLVAGISIYTDSLASQQWEIHTSIGSVAMKVKGDNVHVIIDDISSLPEITSLSTIEKARAFLRMDQDEIFQGSPDNPLNPVFLAQGFAYSLNSEFIESFPYKFVLVVGRWPENGSEIAIAYNDAAYWNIPIGRMMNYTHTLNGEKRTVFVVGIFTQPDSDAIELYATDAVAIVTEDVLNPEDKSIEIFANIDRTIITPLDGRGSLARLQELDDKIKALDPDYSPTTPYSEYIVENYLEVGVREYIDWLNTARLHQIGRSQGTILLGGMLFLMAVRFNTDARKDELRLWFSRGASNRRITTLVVGEILGISILSCVFALFFGIVGSRLAYASTDFLHFESNLLSSSSFMITYDTLFFLLAISIVTPLIVYAINQRTKSEEIIEEQEHGRLARFTRALRMIRWDAAILVTALLFLIALNIGGNTVRNIPSLMFIFYYLPIPLFLGIASLLSKILLQASNVISKIYSRMNRQTVSYLGIRRIGKRVRYAAPVILVIGITMSVSLNSMIIAESIPQTQINHSRFLIGADVTFHLNIDSNEYWPTIFEWTANHTNVESISMASVGTLTFSEGSSGEVEFIAINPSEFIKVGFSYLGIGLEESSLSMILNDLELNTEGAIISQDVANEYDVHIGDSIRAFTINEIEDITEFNVIGIVPALSAPNTINAMLTDQGEALGLGKVWVNSEYLSSIIDLNGTSENFLCVRTKPGYNGTALGEDFELEFGPSVLEADGWSAVEFEVDALVSQSQYQIDRAIDSMLVMISIFSVVLALTLYRIQGNLHGKRENAILRTLGAGKRNIISTQVHELLGIVILTFFILAIFGPILVINSVEAGMTTYSIWSFEFPIGPQISINSNMLGFSLGYFIIIPIGLLLLLYARPSHENMTQALDAGWSKRNLDWEEWS
ncbi:MAG: FtsX-like permease family protein [Candidatus Thorarchaeota archaeon]